jgi:hypothetical protein
LVTAPRPRPSSTRFNPSVPSKPSMMPPSPSPLSYTKSVSVPSEELHAK